MAEYTWTITGPEDRELTEARGRRLDFEVDGPATCTFTMSGLSEEAAAIQEFETDLVVYRDGTKIFRGRILTEQDALTASGHTVTFSAKDYRGLLDYRLVSLNGLSWSGEDQAQIAWDLIAHTQAQTGGALGITEGLGSSSATNRDRTIEPGAKISEALGSLGRLINGFEWEISPELELNRWFPRRGTDQGVLLDYGGLCTALNRSLVPDFANAVQVHGSNETSPVDYITVGLASDPRGRWEVFRGYPSIKEQSTLEDRGRWLIGETAVIKPGYSAQMTPGRREGPGQIWLGDTVGLRVNSGRLAVNSAQRVVTVGLSISDGDVETVYLGLIDADAY